MVTSADLSERRLPWLSARDRARLRPALAAARQLRRRARLGAAPADGHAAGLRRGRAAGPAHGIRDIGIYAVDSLRLEKCYRTWKQDLATGYTALEAGLERFVDSEKPDFVGKAALLAEKERGLRGASCRSMLDDPARPTPRCAPVHDGGDVGLATSGGWSFTLEPSVALGLCARRSGRAGQQRGGRDLRRRRAATVDDAGRSRIPRTRGCGPERLTIPMPPRHACAGHPMLHARSAAQAVVTGTLCGKGGFSEAVEDANSIQIVLYAPCS